MKKLVFAVMICISLCGCTNDVVVIGGADGPTDIIVSEDGNKMYEQITTEEAKEIMDSGENIVILDVREKDEYDAGHIKDAVLIPYGEIAEKAENVIPDKDKQILVYCRSGRRSKIAAETLAQIGYTNVKEFGGIIDWQYELIK